MDRDRQLKYLAAREELARRKRAYPLLYLKEHKKQRLFFDYMQDKKVRGVVFSGSNRSGKSVAGAISAICHAYGYWIHRVPKEHLKPTPDGDYPHRDSIPPEYWIRRPDGVPLRNPANVLICSGLSLLKGIGNIMWPEIEAWLPTAVRGSYKPQRGAFGVPLSCTLPNGSTFHFGSIEQGPMQFEGSKLDAVGFDEPPSRPVFAAVWRGLTDFYSPWWMTFTPLGPNAPWLYEEFWRPDRKDVERVEVQIDDNVFLSREARDEFEAGLTCSEEEKEARLSGRFGFLTYKAFPTYADIHHIPYHPIPREWPRRLACDPASRRPFYFLWLAWDTVRNAVFAYREYPFDELHHNYRTTNQTIPDYVTMIRNAEGTERIDHRVIDPRFGPAEYSLKGVKHTSVVDDFMKFGMIFDTRIPNISREEAGIERIRQLLWYDTKQPATELNRPKLFVMDTCKSLDFALRNYTFVAPNIRDERILPEKTTEFVKDPIDTLRYGILPGPPVPLNRRQHNYLPPDALEQDNYAGFDFDDL
jgi:hypothetical protein